jgi:hypothetical protein
MFIDFIFKQILEYFLRSGLIYAALFFGEKYIIEYLTKKTIDSFVFNSNKSLNVSNLSFSTFFSITVSFIFYTISFTIIAL